MLLLEVSLSVLEVSGAGLLKSRMDFMARRLPRFMWLYGLNITENCRPAFSYFFLWSWRWEADWFCEAGVGWARVGVQILGWCGKRCWVGKIWGWSWTEWAWRSWDVRAECFQRAWGILCELPVSSWCLGTTLINYEWIGCLFNKIQFANPKNKERFVRVIYKRNFRLENSG